MIKNLKGVQHKEIVDTLHLAFSDYAIKMVAPYDYWKIRWRLARIDYSLSFGYFFRNKLVGFVLHGIDNWDGQKSFFNMGTGVVPKHRGKRIVKQIYDYARPILKKNKVESGYLEVIQDNTKAIKAYKSVGFNIDRKINGYFGKVIQPNKEFQFKLSRVNNLKKYKDYKFHKLYWEQMNNTINAGRSEFAIYDLKKDSKLKGYVVIKKSNKQVLQFGVYNNQLDKFGDALFGHLSEIYPDYKLINIDQGEPDTIAYFKSRKFKPLIKQYWMRVNL